jgi:hypothetical protein
MHIYQTFGLVIQTALALPELLRHEEPYGVGERKADVTIRFGRINDLPREVEGANRYVWPTSAGIYLGWRDVGVFFIHGGDEIIVDPAPGVEEPLLRLFILGTTLAMLLHQRGELAVLHASVVAVADQAVAFVGAKEAGKSTMAAALHARGHQLLSDDILAVDLRQGIPFALPGFPQLKLWPDALASLGYDAGVFPRLRPELEKRSRRLNVGFADAPVPLKGIFALEPGPELAVVPLQPRQALTALMPHWYGARFGIKLLQALGLSTHFLQCAELARKIPVWCLRRPNDLAALPEVVRQVETRSVNT